MLITSQGRAVQNGAGHVAGSSYPSDVWALGCLLYELLTQHLLFQEYGNNYPKFHAVVTGTFDEVTSCIATTLSSRCLSCCMKTSCSDSRS